MLPVSRFLHCNCVLGILCYEDQKVRINHPQSYYLLNFRHRVFTLRDFVLERIIHFEFALFWLWSITFSEVVNIHYHYALGGESDFCCCDGAGDKDWCCYWQVNRLVCLVTLILLVGFE